MVGDPEPEPLDAAAADACCCCGKRAGKRADRTYCRVVAFPSSVKGGTPSCSIVPP
jgi:hypothetical protein